MGKKYADKFSIKKHSDILKKNIVFMKLNVNISQFVEWIQITYMVVIH